MLNLNLLFAQNLRAADLENFDEETRELFAKRQNDPRTSYLLRITKRKDRNHLPIVVDPENNPYLQEL